MTTRLRVRLQLLHVLLVWTTTAHSLLPVALAMNHGNHHNSNKNHEIQKVVVVGGTHGNEYTGIWCIQALERQLKNKQALYSTFALSTILGNPEAYQANKRFIHVDLNRQFSQTVLGSPSQRETVEGRRANELNELLGPKSFHATTDNINRRTEEHPKTDWIIDLHTTTTNMGITLIVGAGDPWTTQAAAYVMAKLHKKKVYILIHTHASQAERPHVASIAPHSLSIEVGPVPQGVLRHDKVKDTQEALDCVLDFIQRKQTEPTKVMQELHDHFASSNKDNTSKRIRVPCIRSKPAQRAGEMSSKIVWPSASDNPNFPQWMVHESVQDCDVDKWIYKGDPLFVDLDNTVIPYDGSHGSPIRLLFVNEGGYYYASSGTGISVAQTDSFWLETGTLVNEEEAVVGSGKSSSSHQKEL